MGELGATAASVTAALGFITSILGFFKSNKNPATGEICTEVTVTEGQVTDLMNQSETMSEVGCTIAQPEAGQTFWQKAGSFVNNIPIVLFAGSNSFPYFCAGILWKKRE